MANAVEIVIKAKDEASKTIEQVTKTTETLGTSFADTAKAGAAFGVGLEAARIAAEKIIGVAVQAAEAIGKLAEKGEEISNRALISGFAIDSVQQLERLSKNAGIASDSVFAAISKMQRAAVEGKKGFTQLGMGMQEFLSLAPEDQLRAVAERIMSLPTAADRAAAAMDLFGRSGAQLLPILDDLAHGSDALAVTLADDQVVALKDLDDALDNAKGAWSDLKDQFVAAIATSPDAADGINNIAIAISALAKYAKENRAVLEDYVAILLRIAHLAGPNSPLGALNLAGVLLAGGPKPVTPIGLPGGNPLDEGRYDPMAAWREMDLRSGTIGMQRAAIALDRERERSAQKLQSELERLERRQIDGAMKVEEEQSKSWDRLDKAAAAHANYVAAQDEKAWDEQEKRLREEERLSEQLRLAEVKGLEEQRKHREALASSFGSLADVFGSVREGLVAMGVDGDSVLMRLTVVLQTAASAAQGFMSALAKDDTFGMIASGIAGVVGILSAIGIGGNKVVMQVNDMRDSFFAAHGGWLQLSKDLSQLTDRDLVGKIFNAKTVEQFNAAVAEAMNLLDTQKRAQEELQAAIEKYGITIEELGPKFAQQELDKQAAQLLKEFELLTAAGVDVNTVIAKMGPNLVEFVQTSIAAGATIPEAMRPVIEQLIASGQLLDANGNAFKSVEEAGITFAQSLTESMQAVIEEIRNLVAALTGIPRNVTTTVTTRYEKQYTGGEDQAGSEYNPGPDEMRRGGVVLPFVPRAANGIVTARPGGRNVIVGEGGQAELVAPVAALADRIGRAAAAAAGSGSQVVQVVLDGRVLAEAMVRRNRAGALPITADSVRR